jgi:hypothetical protein
MFIICYNHYDALTEFNIDSCFGMNDTFIFSYKIQNNNNNNYNNNNIYHIYIYIYMRPFWYGLFGAAFLVRPFWLAAFMDHYRGTSGIINTDSKC